MVAIAGAILYMSFGRAPARNLEAQVPSATRRAAPPLPSAPLSLSGAPVLGRRDAKVGMVVYSDFECPFCGKFARETLPALKEQYVNSGQMLIAFRNFPLPNHRLAHKAAEAAACAAKQEKFWTYHDDLFVMPLALEEERLLERSLRLGLDAVAFRTCLAGEATSLVRSERANAQPLGVTGTPTFFVGAMESGTNLRVVERISGAQPLEKFKMILDRLLIGVEPAPL